MKLVFELTLMQTAAFGYNIIIIAEKIRFKLTESENFNKLKL